MTKDGMDDWTGFERSVILDLKDKTVSRLGEKQDKPFFHSWVSPHPSSPGSTASIAIDRSDSIINILGMDNRFVLAGGWFASLYHNEEPKDYDIFILCGKDPTVAQKVYMELLHFIDTNEYQDDRYTHHNPNIWKVRKSIIKTDTGVPIQFIFSKFTERKEVVEDFDLVHTMVSYHLDKLWISRDTYDAIKTKSLVKNKKSPKELHSWRIDKFVKRGWKDLTVS